MSLELHLLSKTAIFTGANARIGSATAKASDSEGVNVVSADCNQQGLEKAVIDIQSLPTTGTKVIGISTDLTKLEDVDKIDSTTVEQFANTDSLTARGDSNSEPATKPKLKKRNLFFLLGSFLFVPVAFLFLLVVVVLLAPIVGEQEI